jgi:DMSO/TMAO reductase YedYZ molybdopterin-dependent catalytic subunit
MSRLILSRRALAAGAAAGLGGLMLSGCDRLSRAPSFLDVLDSAEGLTYRAQRLLQAGQPLAREFSRADLSPVFKVNGTEQPGGAAYQALMQDNFAAWRLAVGGLVARPLSLSLAQLRALPGRTQITRHDCVEGWSYIAKWSGTPLGPLLDQAGIKPEARYALYHCYDTMDGGLAGQVPYYETSDLIDAHHPQTILAYGLNNADLPVANGAPIRVRIERALGYKQPKYVHTIELVDSFAAVGNGKGGYWEDNGYDWYGGI